MFPILQALSPNHQGAGEGVGKGAGEGLGMKQGETGMTDIDPLVLKIQGAKIDAQKRGLWATVRSLDQSEKAIGSELQKILHPTYDYEGRPTYGFEGRQYTTHCEYCLDIACDKDPKWPQPMCSLRLIQIRASPREWTRKMWVCVSCVVYLRGVFRNVK